MENQNDIYDSPSGRILRFLLARGESTVKVIEDGLDVTRNAIRIQVDHLVAQGLLDSRLVKSERGRPYRVYFLTDKGRDTLPNHYKDLAKSLWQEISKITDADKKEAILQTISSRMAEDYKERVNGNSVKERINGFVNALNKEGIPSELNENKEEYTLNEYHCPYYEVAKENSEICAVELEMMGKLLGKNVERSEWLLTGSSGCQFKLRKD